MCVHLWCVRVDVHAIVHMWRPEDNSVELTPSSTFMWVLGTDLRPLGFAASALLLSHLGTHFVD